MRENGMKRALAFIALAALLSGCANFSATQEDTSESGRKIITKVRGTCWFTSAQHLTGVKLTQTDKTQSFGTATIGQQGATNTVEMLDALARVLSTLRPTP